LIELDRIHNISWQEGFKEIPDKSIDLIITSPPYNMGKKLHTGSNYMDIYNKYDDNLPEEEYQNGQIELLNESFRVLKDNGSMFYNHKPRIREGLTIHPLNWIFKSDFILKQEIIWRTGSQNFDKIRYYPMTERVYWLTKDVKTKLFNSVGMSDIWEFKNPKRNKLHKSTFPVDLPYNIIKCFDDAETILDPYMGIGTTALAVKKCNAEDNNGRNYLGFELDDVYVKEAYNRMAE